MADYIKSINGYPIVMSNGAYYGTCGTSAGTSTKVVTCSGIQELVTGLAITVRFSTANTVKGSLSLNVNSTGAKTVYVNGRATLSDDTLTTSNILLWAAGAVLTFVYDGTHWDLISEPRCWFGRCSTAASTASKTADINEVVIATGTRVSLGMTYENTSSSATLNLSSTGSIPIRYGTGSNVPTTSNGYGWAGGDMVDFVFDGYYWRLADTTALTKLKNL